MVKRWLEPGLSGVQSTLRHTHSHPNQPSTPDPSPNRRAMPRGSPGGGSACGWRARAPARPAPWTSHLEGNLCAFGPAGSGSPGRAPSPWAQHGASSSVSSLPLPASGTEEHQGAGCCRWVFIYPRTPGRYIPECVAQRAWQAWPGGGRVGDP